MGRVAAVLGFGAAIVPVAVGVLAEPAAAAASGGSTISVQQVVAGLGCDPQWIVWDVGNLEGPPAPGPWCTPWPPQLLPLFQY
ncbi:MAG TPA: hypothetical protein VMP41_10280 [Acidimicrobiales bacterium]|nr:hypothetical protein [Acidimicrobiales bacterium]